MKQLTLENIKLREQVYELQEYIKDLENADKRQKDNIISLNETIDVLNSIVDSEKLVKKADLGAGSKVIAYRQIFNQG